MVHSKTNQIKITDRTTEELILTLADDYTRCHFEMVKILDKSLSDKNGNVTVSSDYYYYARQLCRTFFAFVEGVTFSVKIKAIDYCQQKNIEVTPQECFFGTEDDFRLDEKGRVISHRAHINLSSNVRFAFALLERAHRIKSRFNPNDKWWGFFQSSIKVRDRLMHPKLPGDLDLSHEEIMAVFKAMEGFQDHLLSYPSLIIN